ncbi:endonuclease domain-containing protein [Streptomyces sp. NPDC057694]|uniref:endonuclease domain-containing protein n=1 Tax=Streptomyces sp. NPDC057694 TaxID=3346216 RepID=UPI0036CCEAE3
MLIGRERARSLFTDLTQSATVPADPDELLHMPGLAHHGHVFFGDIAVRCYKHKARWMYDDRDIRRVGQTFAELRVDLVDIVDVQLPAYRDSADDDTQQRQGADWRSVLVSWMFGLARHKAHDGVPYAEWTDDWRQVGVNGLPGDLTWEEFVAASSRYRHTQNLAGTRPLELLTWSGQKWLLPRAYVELLDRWEEREDELVRLAQVCSSCGGQGPYRGGWRTSTSSGYVTKCPPCSGAALQSYAGHLRGVQYESPRRRRTRADDYLCCLCKESQASAWDHCHGHGYVRGPLCGSCNTRECKATPERFLQLDGAALHLLECRGCLEQRILPRRFHLGVVLAHLEQTERHGRCRRRPFAREVEYLHGVHQFQLECFGWHAKNSNWTKSVTVSEVHALVRAFVDATLAEREIQPSRKGP